MSDSLEGVFDPKSMESGPVFGVDWKVEFAGKSVRCSCLWTERREKFSKYCFQFREAFDVSDLFERDWGDFSFTGANRTDVIKKEDIIGVKITSKAIKLKVRRHI